MRRPWPTLGRSAKWKKIRSDRKVVKIALLEFSLLVFIATVFKCRRIGWMDYVVVME
jgi:hypothetical protein